MRLGGGRRQLRREVVGSYDESGLEIRQRLIASRVRRTVFITFSRLCLRVVLRRAHIDGKSFAVIVVVGELARTRAFAHREVRVLV